MTTITAEANGLKLEITLRLKDTGTKSRMYIWPKGESILHNLENRRSRPHNYYRKEIVPVVLEQMNNLAKMNNRFSPERSPFWIDPESKISWRQTAGCDCGCSPGFIINYDFSYDLHIDVEQVS